MTPSQAAAISIARSVAARLAAEDEETDQAKFIAACEAEGADVESVVRALCRASGEAEKKMEDLQKTIKENTARLARFKNRVAAYNSALMAVLDAVGRRMWDLPEATAVIVSPRPRVQVTDLAAIPDNFVHIKRIPDLTAIGSAIENGATVPGAEMRNGLPSLRIKRT